MKMMENNTLIWYKKMFEYPKQTQKQTKRKKGKRCKQAPERKQIMSDRKGALD
jgi:hypothetical protein